MLLSKSAMVLATDKTLVMPRPLILNFEAISSRNKDVFCSNLQDATSFSISPKDSLKSSLDLRHAVYSRAAKTPSLKVLELIPAPVFSTDFGSILPTSKWMLILSRIGPPILPWYF